MARVTAFTRWCEVFDRSIEIVVGPECPIGQPQQRFATDPVRCRLAQPQQRLLVRPLLELRAGDEHEMSIADP
jgi:hypothetical protein